MTEDGTDFTVVLNSDPHLGDTVSGVSLSLTEQTLKFTAEETPKFEWTDWLLRLPEEESVTLFLGSEEGRTCALAFDGLYIAEHGLSVPRGPGESGLSHKITVQFTSVQKLAYARNNGKYTNRKSAEQPQGEHD